MSTKPTQVKLPQWLRDFTNPDPRVNPHFERILHESSQWINSYGFDAYQKQEIELFGALVYPSSDYPVVRLGADFIHYLFALDEITDKQDSSGARLTLGLVQLGFEKPKEDHSSPFSLAMADIFNRFSSLAAGVNSTERFVAHMRSYLKAVITQATLREQNQGFVSVYEYRKERRQNSAVLLVYDLVELQSGIDLPSAVYDSPEFSKVYFAAVDIICITNDVYSFAMEQAIGHTELYSYVTVYMNQYRFNLAEAIEHADREVRGLWSDLSVTRKILPSFDEQTDKDVNEYIDGLVHWIEGYIHWTFKSTRYFGEATQTVRDTHTLTL